MAIAVEEQFEVEASPEVVWQYVSTPQDIVICLPGAELLDVVDDRTYRGRVKVKVGPMTVSYTGTVTFVEMDEQRHRLKMTGKAKERGGAGTAKMTTEVTIEPCGAGSRVAVQANADVTGRIVRFGRGMIEQVAKQLFGQFAEAVRANLEAKNSEAPSPAAPQQDAEPLAEVARTPRPEPTAGVAGSTGRSEPADAEPIAGLPLLLAALRNALADLLVRLAELIRPQPSR